VVSYQSSKTCSVIGLLRLLFLTHSFQFINVPVDTAYNWLQISTVKVQAIEGDKKKQRRKENKWDIRKERNDRCDWWKEIIRAHQSKEI
jgi:hypothetical protein